MMKKKEEEEEEEEGKLTLISRKNLNNKYNENYIYYSFYISC